MQKVITGKGQEYNVLWIGVSTIDAALRFETVGASMADVITTFTDTEETQTLTHIFNDHETVYTGYTGFKGVDLRTTGSIVVSLIKEETQ